ncbi:MAG: cytochrome c oxidase subunit II [Solirubrobacterales bacterium]|nr:cytochrome c oxidase subunit II [Solirubrobacterales bacterium]
MATDRSRNRRRVFALALAASLAGGLVLAGGASADLWTPESGGSSNADDIDTLYKIVLAVAAVVFVGVEGVLLYSIVKFRARKDAVPAQIRGNTRLEIGWTLGATVVLVVLAVVTFAMLPSIRTPPNSDADGFSTAKISNIETASAFQPRPPNGRALNIKVNGQRYVWRYTYPGAKADTPENQKVAAYVELVVPTKTTVTLDIDAQDVAHSWWIPALGGKFDAVPGHTNFTWLKIDKPGVYRGQCAELCGRNHADMVAQVRAIEPAEFKTWLEDKKREIDENNTGARERREADAAKQEEDSNQAGSGGQDDGGQSDPGDQATADDAADTEAP